MGGAAVTWARRATAPPTTTEERASVRWFIGAHQQPGAQLAAYMTALPEDMARLEHSTSAGGQCTPWAGRHCWRAQACIRVPHSDGDHLR
jgi:hypothetical protein